ncbi:MAG: hypothetical protein QF793_01610 [Candidatus Peribacteraceae bacterium]|jgi:hypothetical protein|nr:hypothetical protein [bacterium]MDP6561600.1 hypothetical protein [Candidatus Peribacteraceae bacterium]|tara:strand:- start:18750 stop:18995 length:246 start_codon:yes stop_codon:yes gene_type:complete
MWTNALFIVLQLLSLAVMVLFIHQCKSITYKHQDLLDAVDEGTPPKCMMQSTVIIWMYIITTIAVMTGMTFLFINEGILFS